MIAFKVTRNGKRITTAGLPENGCLSATLMVTTVPTREGEMSPEFYLFVSGSDSRCRLRDWKVGNVKVGDRVELAIVETTKVDQGTSRGRLNLIRMLENQLKAIQQRRNAFLQALKALEEDETRTRQQLGPLAEKSKAKRVGRQHSTK